MLCRTCALELGYSIKNPNKGCWGHTFFWKRPLEFVDLSLYPWKFQTKWSFTPGNSTKSCYTHWIFQGQKPRPMEIPPYFFLDHAWKFHFFFIDSWSFQILFFQSPWKFHVLTSPRLPQCFFFSGIPSPLEVVTASQTEIYKLLIQQSTRFGQRTPNHVV